jgi:hypothetical protein
MSELLAKNKAYRDAIPLRSFAKKKRPKMGR